MIWDKTSADKLPVYVGTEIMTAVRITKATFLACLLAAVGAIGMAAFTAPDSPPQPVVALAPDIGYTGVGSSKVLDPSTLADSWRQFRGLQSRGVTGRSDLPKSWSTDDNILWEAILPGQGASSPISHFQRIFVTSSSGYGDSFEQRGDKRYLKHHVNCLDAATGRSLWQRDIVGSPLTQELNHQILQHGLASSTPVTDGVNVYAFFGVSGVFAFDSRGELMWHADVGFEHSQYGSAASPIIFKNYLIINASAESESIIALDTKTGRGLWRINDVKESWSTPVIGRNGKGELELIVQDRGRVRGFELLTGEELWTCEGPEGYAASTPFTESGVVYCTGGLSKKLMAIKLGGRGDVTKTHKLWEIGNASRHTSPLYLTGHVYVMSESGVFRCFNAHDGSLVSAKRIPTSGRVHSSPILAGNYFYLPCHGNRVFVARASRDLELVRDNQIQDDEPLMASLCPSANSLLIRTGDRLRCVLASDYEKKLVRSSVSRKKLIDNVNLRYELDPQSGSLKQYNSLLQRDAKGRLAALLDPVDLQLNYQQRNAAKKLLMNDKGWQELDALLTRQRNAYWAQLASDAPAQSELTTQLAAIEAETLRVAEEVRLRVIGQLKASGVDSVASR